MDKFMQKLEKLDLDKVTTVVNKMKNAVMNYGEYEVKVREATNNDPWGASSTLMTEISSGTHNFQYFPEIMETIYKKFLETGKNWRQAYKALQLLEYLIKNGAERVVDNAREHVYEVKALTKFHYIDEKGKDQGINVRNRAKEIVELLADTERIKDERRKARENKSKYGGVSSDQFNSGSRYGGFGSNGTGAYPTSSGGMFRDEESPRSATSNNNNNNNTSSSSFSSNSNVTSPAASKPSQPAAAELLDFGSFAAAPPAAKPASSGFDDFGGFTSAPVASAGNDDFADFQAAPAPAPAPVASFVAPTTNTNNNFGAFASFPPPPSSTTTTSITSPPANNNNNNNNNAFASFASFSSPSTNSTSFAAFTSTPQQPQQSQSKPDDIFGKLVNLDPMSLSAFGQKKDATGPSLNAIAATPTPAPAPATPASNPTAGMSWGFNNTTQPAQQTQQQQGQGFDSLLL